MEILLAFAVAAAAVTCLVIAATFRARTIKHSAPAIDEARQELTNRMDGQYKLTHSEAERMRLSSEKAVAKLETRINELAEGQHGNLAQADHLRALINDLQKTVRNAHAQFQGMAADIRQTQGDIVSDLQNIHASIGQLETGNDQAKVAIDRLKQQIAKTLTSLNSLSGRIDAASNSIGGLRDGLTANEKEVHRLSSFDQELEKRLVYASQEIAPVRQELDEVRLCIERALEYMRTATGDLSQSRLIVGSLSSDPSSAQIVWKLCGAFWAALSMKLLFRYSANSTTTFFYLVWSSPDGRAVEECIATLVRNCQPEHETVTGWDEFNGILQALYDGKPATLKIGSAVITWSGGELLAGIIAEDQASAGDTALLQPATYAARLRQPDSSSFVDLTAWARDYGS